MRTLDPDEQKLAAEIWDALQRREPDAVERHNNAPVKVWRALTKERQKRGIAAENGDEPDAANPFEEMA